MPATIYARVSDDLKTATDAYAADQGMTLAQSVSRLLEIGLQSEIDKQSVQALEAEVATLRSRDAQMRVIGQRLTRPVGNCPNCSKPVTGEHLLAAGACPACGENLLNVLAESEREGLDEGDVKVLLAAVGVVLGIALLTQSS